MCHPSVVSPFKRDQVVSENRAPARQQRRAERGFPVAAVAQKRDCFSLDVHDRAMQRIDAERQERKGKHLTEQVDRERFEAGPLLPVVQDPMPVRRDQELKESRPLEVGGPIRQPTTGEPVFCRARVRDFGARTRELRRATRDQFHICGDARSCAGTGKGKATANAEPVKLVVCGAPAQAMGRSSFEFSAPIRRRLDFRLWPL